MRCPPLTSCSRRRLPKYEYLLAHRESLLSPSFFSATFIDSGRQFSKIGKVMRHIHLLEENRIPRDDEFKFRERAKALVDKWHEIL
ncbi:hypothetical protein DFH09DRAFT_979145, partial [Mycena vulgaris]